MTQSPADTSAAVAGGRGRLRRSAPLIAGSLIAAAKSGTRKHISSLGYTIVADFGDQFSDLLGGDAGHQVKLPNPMYYIP
jgi:HAD superfamily, subfamily IIIB (Acid phosphatase)